jgi:hypothetical protein
MKQCRLTGKSLGLVSWHSTQVLEIALVPYQHDNNVGVGMIPQFFQPSVDILVGRVLCNVIDKKSAYSSSIITTSRMRTITSSKCMSENLR